MALYVDTTKAKPDAAWLQQINTIRQALVTRGGLSTRLSVKLGSSHDSQAAAALLLARLRGVGQGVRELEVTWFVTIPVSGAQIHLLLRIPRRCRILGKACTSTGE